MSAAHRPAGFYDDWSIFCREAVVQLVETEEASQKPKSSAVLLAAGAFGALALGGIGYAIRNAVDRIGNAHGLPNLGNAATAGGALLGGATGALLAQALAKDSNAVDVDALQDMLSQARELFASLKRDRDQKIISPLFHQQSVDNLFKNIVSQPLH